MVAGSRLRRRGFRALGTGLLKRLVVWLAACLLGCSATRSIDLLTDWLVGRLANSKFSRGPGPGPKSNADATFALTLTLTIPLILVLAL
jgi:hypothetical protein